MFGSMSNFVIGHEVLFAPPILAKCDACGREMSPYEMADDESAASHGVYVTTRGDDVRFEKAPLCDACNTALGVTALMQWNIEEEEG